MLTISFNVVTEEDSDEYDHYIINDGLGMSHVVRRPEGRSTLTQDLNGSSGNQFIARISSVGLESIVPM